LYLPSLLAQTEVDSTLPTPDTVIPKPVPVKRIAIPRITDTVTRAVIVDSLPKSPLIPFNTEFDWVTNLKKYLSEHPYFNFTGKAVARPEIRKVWRNYDLMFYVL